MFSASVPVDGAALRSASAMLRANSNSERPVMAAGANVTSPKGSGSTIRMVDFNAMDGHWRMLQILAVQKTRFGRNGFHANTRTDAHKFFNKRNDLI